MNQQISIKDMTCNEARDYLLKKENYCTISLPEYIDFEKVIENVKRGYRSKKGGQKSLKDYLKDKAKDKIENESEDGTRIAKLSEIDDVNYTIMNNKDGAYSWRPITLIHPLIYVNLVNFITIEKNWNKILELLNKPKKIIYCTSLPVESFKRDKDTKGVILNWWKNFEQLQIKKSMEYKYCMHTDISNCYPSIYTHSIPWAIMGKEDAKARKGDNCFGNNLDELIRHMQYGQTNGIPQGSVLMDLIAEIVLNGVDLEIEKKLTEYKGRVEIFRYRDDYRIFGNTIEDVHEVTKYISEILSTWNFSLNSNKTFLSKDIISDAFKKGKRYWHGKQPILKDLNVQQHLLQIKELADRFPNSSSLKGALNNFHKEYFGEGSEKKINKNNISYSISILVNIMDNNSKVIEYCVVIISEMLSLISVEEACQYLEYIYNRFKNYPNADYTEIWLQRLNIPYGNYFYDKNKLARKINEPSLENNIWNHNWIPTGFDEDSIIDYDKIADLDRIIDMSLLDPFDYDDLG